MRLGPVGGHHAEQLARACHQRSSLRRQYTGGAMRASRAGAVVLAFGEVGDDRALAASSVQWRTRSRYPRSRIVKALCSAGSTP